MSCAILRTGLRAPHMVLAGALVPVGTVLVTPGLWPTVYSLIYKSYCIVFCLKPVADCTYPAVYILLSLAYCP